MKVKIIDTNPGRGATDKFGLSAPGATPATPATPYASPIDLAAPTVVSAQASAGGGQSAIARRLYQQLPSPTVTPGNGGISPGTAIYVLEVMGALGNAPIDLAIHYTNDGTPPTADSPTCVNQYDYLNGYITVDAITRTPLAFGLSILSQTWKFIATSASWITSPVTTRTYMSEGGSNAGALIVMDAALTDPMLSPTQYYTGQDATLDGVNWSMGELKDQNIPFIQTPYGMGDIKFKPAGATPAGFYIYGDAPTFADFIAPIYFAFSSDGITWNSARKPSDDHFGNEGGGGPMAMSANYLVVGFTGRGGPGDGQMAGIYVVAQNETDTNWTTVIDITVDASGVAWWDIIWCGSFFIITKGDQARGDPAAYYLGTPQSGSITAGGAWVKHNISIGFGVAYSPDLGLIIAADSLNGGIKTSPDGVTWSSTHALPSGGGISAQTLIFDACWSVEDQRFYVVDENLRILSSPDGAVWTYMSRFGAESAFKNTGGLLWTYRFGLRTFKGFLFFSKPGEIWRSGDQGATWTKVQSCTTLNSMARMALRPGEVTPILPQVQFSPTPAAALGNPNVTLSCPGEGGATIHYTVDGTTPTAGSPVYTTPIVVSGSNPVTIKAYATLGGFIDSTVSQKTYIANQNPGLPPPTLTPASSGFVPVAVTLSVPGFAGAVVRYTLDGTTPSDSSPGAVAPFTLSATDYTTITCLSQLTGYIDSPIATGQYRATPQLGPLRIGVQLSDHQNLGFGFAPSQFDPPDTTAVYSYSPDMSNPTECPCSSFPNPVAGQPPLIVPTQLYAGPPATIYYRARHAGFADGPIGSMKFNTVGGPALGNLIINITPSGSNLLINFTLPGAPPGALAIYSMDAQLWTSASVPLGQNFTYYGPFAGEGDSITGGFIYFYAVPPAGSPYSAGQVNSVLLYAPAGTQLGQVVFTPNSAGPGRTTVRMTCPGAPFDYQILYRISKNGDPFGPEQILFSPPNQSFNLPSSQDSIQFEAYALAGGFTPGPMSVSGIYGSGVTGLNQLPPVQFELIFGAPQKVRMSCPGNPDAQIVVTLADQYQGAQTPTQAIAPPTFVYNPPGGGGRQIEFTVYALARKAGLADSFVSSLSFITDGFPPEFGILV